MGRELVMGVDVEMARLERSSVHGYVCPQVEGEALVRVVMFTACREDLHEVCQCSSSVVEGFVWECGCWCHSGLGELESPAPVRSSPSPRLGAKVPALSPVRSMLLTIRNISEVRARGVFAFLNGVICVDHYKSSRSGQLEYALAQRAHLLSARIWEARKGVYDEVSRGRFLEAVTLLQSLIDGVELEVKSEGSSVAVCPRPEIQD